MRSLQIKPKDASLLLSKEGGGLAHKQLHEDQMKAFATFTKGEESGLTVSEEGLFWDDQQIIVPVSKSILQKLRRMQGGCDVYLYVYDLVPTNAVQYSILQNALYHASVEVYGQEWSFGGWEGVSYNTAIV